MESLQDEASGKVLQQVEFADGVGIRGQKRTLFDLLLTLFEPVGPMR